jgi:hypothetical protein
VLPLVLPQIATNEGVPPSQAGEMLCLKFKGDHSRPRHAPGAAARSSPYDLQASLSILAEILRYRRQTVARLCSAAVLLEESERQKYSTISAHRDAFYLSNTKQVVASCSLRPETDHEPCDADDADAHDDGRDNEPNDGDAEHGDDGLSDEMHHAPTGMTCEMMPLDGAMKDIL